jgi:hypothetical protein
MNWWPELLKGLMPLFGVALGFALAQMGNWWVSRRRRKAHWAALRAELRFCHGLVNTYEKDRIAAPLYRLPTAAYSRSFPALLSEAAVTEDQAMALTRFFSEAETLNRGLDLAQDARNDEAKLAAEFSRNLLKVQRLTACYESALKAVNAHLGDEP